MSTTENEHDWFNEQIATYLADGLYEDERARFESHAQSCESCAAELAAMKQMEGAMSQAFAAVNPGPDFEERVASRLSSTLRLRPEGSLSVKHRRTWIHPAVKRSAIAAAAAIIVGGFGYIGKEYIETGKLPKWNRSVEAIAQVTSPNESNDREVLKNANALDLEKVTNLLFQGQGGQLRGVTSTSGIGGRGVAGARTEANGQSYHVAGKAPAQIIPPGVASKAAGLVGSTIAVADPVTNTLLVTTPPSHWPQVKQVLDELDRPKTMESSFYEVAGTGSFQGLTGNLAMTGGNTGTVLDMAGFNPTVRALPGQTIARTFGGQESAIWAGGTSGGSPIANAPVLGEVTSGAPRDLTRAASDDYVFGGLGTLAGGGRLVRPGTGTLAINNINSYTGGTTIGHGALRVGTIALAQGNTGAVVNAPSPGYFQPRGDVVVNTGTTIENLATGIPGNVVAGLFNGSDYRNGSLGSGPVAINSSTYSGAINGNVNLIRSGQQGQQQQRDRLDSANSGGAVNLVGGATLTGGTIRIRPQTSAGGGTVFFDRNEQFSDDLRFPDSQEAVRRTQLAMAQQPGQQPNVPAAQPIGGAAAQAPAQTAPTIRKVIREGVMEFEVESFDSTFTQVSTITSEEGGFIAAADSDKLPNGKMRGAITLRVPPDNLDRLVLKLRALGELKSQKLGSKDIGREYTDLEGQLRAARAMEERLLEIIKTAEGEVADLLQAERELGTWRTKIELITGQLNYYNNLVSMATLTINAFEKDIRTPASASQTEEINTGLETDNVETARAAAIAKVNEVKGRIIESTLQQLDAGQFAAKVVAEVPTESAGEIVDRLRQLGRIARLDLQRKQTPAQGTGSLSVQPRVEQAPTRIIISMYNLANVAPRLTTNLNIAGEDVEAVYRAILARVQAASGRVVSSNLNRQDATQAIASIQFEVKSNEADAVLNDIRTGARSQILQMNVTENPDTANVTTAKQAFTVQIVPTSRVAPRETRALTVETSDVEAGMQNLTGSVGTAGGRVLESSLSLDQAGRSVARLVVEVPLNQADPLVDAARKQGKVRTAESAKNTQVPEGPLARVRLTILIGSGETIVPADGGVWQPVREGLSTSIKGLMWSLQLIVIGVCLVAPWVLIIWGGWKLARRGKRASSTQVQ